MEFARNGGIIGQGRGSAGDSIVAYCLGITKVDPIEHKLLFERFINEARTLPDIDIDFDVNRREEVIQYLYDRYGADHAAMVCTVDHLSRPLRGPRGGQVTRLPARGRSMRWPRRSTRAMRPTSLVTWRSMAASDGSSTSSRWTWPMRPCRPVAMAGDAAAPSM